MTLPGVHGVRDYAGRRCAINADRGRYQTMSSELSWLSRVRRCRCAAIACLGAPRSFTALRSCSCKHRLQTDGASWPTHESPCGSLSPSLPGACLLHASRPPWLPVPRVSWAPCCTPVRGQVPPRAMEAAPGIPCESRSYAGSGRVVSIGDVRLQGPFELLRECIIGPMGRLGGRVRGAHAVASMTQSTTLQTSRRSCSEPFMPSHRPARRIGCALSSGSGST